MTHRISSSANRGAVSAHLTSANLEKVALSTCVALGVRRGRLDQPEREVERSHEGVKPERRVAGGHEIQVGWRSEVVLSEREQLKFRVETQPALAFDEIRVDAAEGARQP